jgi:hypothetical protein
MGGVLAAAFETVNREAIEYVLGPASEHWEATTPEEGWPVGVTARHIALSHQLMMGWLVALRPGDPIPSTGDIDEQNAAVAARGIVASPPEVADALRRGGEEVYATLRQLTDEDLGRDVDFGGRRMRGSMVAGAAERT